ncbi:MAG: bifunctional phosphoribosylaminoimidazolecarboxamide formyltransferase/IMP cyclohydrolase [Bacillota bacterium]
MTEGRMALISCSDKEGLPALAAGLVDLGWRIVSTGGTASLLKGQGIPVAEVSEITGHPSLLDGRVKTLHPAIHSGILARRDRAGDARELAERGYEPIDMVVVNLYPFEETASSGAPQGEIIDNIDIGGPTMLRAAAKNFSSVIPLVRPRDYSRVLKQLRERGEVDGETRRQLAAEVFRHVSRYDALIATYLGGGSEGYMSYPEEMAIPLRRTRVLRYGENPHQTAALYVTPGTSPLSVARLHQLQGPDLSYNNLLDVDVAAQLANEFERPAVCALKHNNPCGVAVADSLSCAFRAAYDADPVSIFGGVVAVNRPVDMELVEAIVERELFLDVLVAPEYTPDASERLKRRRKLRALRLAGLGRAKPVPGGLEMNRVAGRLITGGMLLNQRDEGTLPRSAWKVAGAFEPGEGDWPDIEFAWTVAMYTKSNAIVVARDGATLGVGAGQMNRVNAARLALEAAGERARGAVMASDGMLPFPDVARMAAAAGISCLVQPGGSIRDDEIVQAADEAEMAMVFTSRRHFVH